MERRALLSALGVGVSCLAGCTDGIRGADESGSNGQSELPEEYPDGAGPDGIDFTTLESDDETPLHAPRDHWDSYAIVFDEPPDRRRVEGDYYVNSSTGEVISELWYGAKDYRNGDAYAYVQPADGLPDHQLRDEWESDPQFTYHDATDAYYRYDPQYGQIAPTNIGRHTEMVEPYGWEAVGTATHHGVPVVAYRLSDAEPEDSRATPAVEGSIELGVEDGIIYAFDLALDAEGEPRYTYAVRPEPFPDHEWVETARRISGSADGANESA
ncbi:hypothetical protein [Halorubrum sp. Ea8]|uniref:hypothetical protein n=1 Tax=Halorubrum sp. Ea8 TaxID=1383841 RepID=UPI000B984708|nr:hypothetical protein [Halorubrum sp. Ea8]OYR46595.1 hypothetical protein DJ74_15030 [Halorubrum sp. Ea8]